MTDINNSDIRVLASKLDNLKTLIEKLEQKQDSYHSESQERLQIAETQLALFEQSTKIICGDIENLEERQDKNDLLTKIVGGFQGLLTLALIYLGWRK
jgi:septation ring formation regulator EzrA